MSVEVLPGFETLWVEVPVDTGFTGYLTLPPAPVDALSLRILGSESVLADGSVVLENFRTARVLWHGGNDPSEFSWPRPLPCWAWLFCVSAICGYGSRVVARSSSKSYPGRASGRFVPR